MSDTPSVSDRNREYWSSKDNIYANGIWGPAIAKFTEQLPSYKEWIGLPGKQKGRSGETRLLDFACGPGTISHAFFDDVDVVRGLDIADGMVTRYNERARKGGIPEDRMFSAQGDIFASDPSAEPAINSPEFFNFDFAIVANALHHIEDPELAVKKLVERLRPGGVLVVIDWPLEESVQDSQPSLVPHSHEHHHGHGHSHSHHHSHSHSRDEKGTDDKDEGHAVRSTITQPGFSKARMETLLRNAGCQDVEFILSELTIEFPAAAGGAVKNYFLARGKRPE